MRLWRPSAPRRGSVSVELAVLVPALMLVLGLLVAGGRIWFAKTTVNEAAHTAAVLQDDSQGSCLVADRLPRRPLAPDPKCVHPRQPRQQPRRHSPEEASWSWSFIRTWKDIWSWSQGSEAAWKGQAVVPGWSDTFDRQAWSKGFQQLVRRLRIIRQNFEESGIIGA